MTETIRGLKNALVYTRVYRNQVFVVKLGGEILSDRRALENVAAQVALLESLSIRMVVVHGGGPQATELSRRLGVVSEMVAGRRVTSPEALEVAKMVYAGSLNVDLCAALRAHGVLPVGLTGLDGGTLVAKRRPPVEVKDDGGALRTVDFGEVGDVEAVQPALLRSLIEQQYVPVVASLAADGSGRPLNMNADTVAEALASALAAKKLILLTNAPGLLRDVNDPTSLVPFADPEDLEPMLASGAVSGGMRPKIEACIRAVRNGVRRTHIVDGRAEDALLLEVFTGAGSGTMIVNRKEMADYRDHELA
jgi:acetylglutamate kinase